MRFELRPKKCLRQTFRSIDTSHCAREISLWTQKRSRSFFNNESMNAASLEQIHSCSISRVFRILDITCRCIPKVFIARQYYGVWKVWAIAEILLSPCWMFLMCSSTIRVFQFWGTHHKESWYSNVLKAQRLEISKRWMRWNCEKDKGWVAKANHSYIKNLG